MLVAASVVFRVKMYMHACPETSSNNMCRDGICQFVASALLEMPAIRAYTKRHGSLEAQISMTGFVVADKSCPNQEAKQVTYPVLPTCKGCKKHKADPSCNCMSAASNNQGVAGYQRCQGARFSSFPPRHGSSSVRVLLQELRCTLRQ